MYTRSKLNADRIRDLQHQLKMLEDLVDRLRLVEAGDVQRLGATHSSAMHNVCRRLTALEDEINKPKGGLDLGKPVSMTFHMGGVDIATLDDEGDDEARD